MLYFFFFKLTRIYTLISKLITKITVHMDEKNGFIFKKSNVQSLETNTFVNF